MEKINSRNYYRGGHPSGFTLIEVMLALTLLAILSSAIRPVYRLIANANQKSQNFYQDETGIYQLQLQLAKNTITAVTNEAIYYQTVDNECIIHIVNNKLLSQPGSLDFIHDVGEVSFYLEDNIVYVEYERVDQLFKWPIAFYYE